MISQDIKWFRSDKDVVARQIGGPRIDIWAKVRGTWEFWTFVMDESIADFDSKFSLNLQEVEEEDLPEDFP